jgi:hypothetical protein
MFVLQHQRFSYNVFPIVVGINFHNSDNTLTDLVMEVVVFKGNALCSLMSSLAVSYEDTRFAIFNYLCCFQMHQLSRIKVAVQH